VIGALPTSWARALPLLATLGATLAVTFALGTARAAGMPLPPEPTLQDYLAAFDAAYAPPDHVTLALVDAESAALRAERAAGPRVGMEQSLHVTDFRAVDFDVTTYVTVPLYSAQQPLDAAIAAVTLDQQRASARTTKVDARARFAGDVLAFALLSGAAADLERAVERARADGWPGVPPGLDPNRVAPEARDAYLQERKLTDLLRFLRAHVADLRQAVAHDIDVDPARIEPPPSDATVTAFLTTPPTHARCLADAPSAGDARARADRRLLQDARDATPTATVDLVAGVGVRTGSRDALGATSMEMHGSIGLEARIATPSTWPVAGDASATVDLAGIRQSLRVTWPPRLTPVLQAGRSADLVLHDELEALDANLHSLRRAYEQAASRRAERELRLAWFVRDVQEGAGAGGSQVDDHDLVPGPVADLHAAELRTSLAFARLDEALAWIELRLACGASV
jgi:hypothetical protein